MATDRREAAEEKDGRQSEFLKTVLDSIPHPFYVISTEDYTVTLANSAARFGDLSAASTCHALTHRSETPCGSAEHPCPLEEVKRTGRPASVEHLHYDADGKARPVEVHAYPILDDEGNVSQMIEYCFDITERRRAEEQIRSLARFPSENTSPVLRVSSGGRVLYANEAGRALLRGWDSDVGGEAPGLWRQLVVEATESRAPRDAEIEHRGRAYSVAVAPVADEGYANLYVTDSTERRRAEEALKRSEERYALAQRAAQIGSWDWDIATGDLAWSDTIEPMFGFERGKFGATYEAFLECVHPEDRRLVIDSINACVEGGADYAIAHRIVWPDGTVRWVSETGDVIRDGNGTAVRMLGVVQDTTERKRAEEGLQRARDELERRVEERTAELRASQQQLLQSQKMEAIGRLAGGIAHDFNNMMQVVTGYAHRVMADLAPDDPKRKSVEGIKQAGERAAALTHQLLAFSRKQVLNPTVIDLNGVVWDIDGMLRRVLGEDVALVTVLCDELGRVKADRARIEQVIMNLAINARDAMPEGGKLTIETGNVELGDSHPQDGPAVPPGPYVMLAVRDTGCGMDEETQSQIFEPFFTTKKPGEGTGLGLSTAYGTIRQSGGVIRVYGEPEQGTTFKIYLPRVEGAVEPDAAGQTDRGARGGTETILLVEDDDSVRDLVAVELRDIGYTVIEASNAGEAILRSELHDGAIDLLVTDVVLPDRNGRAVYDGVLAVHPGVRALYMSGHTEDHVVHRGVLDPGTCFLAKPFTDDELAAKVREALGGSGASTG